VPDQQIVLTNISQTTVLAHLCHISSVFVTEHIPAIESEILNHASLSEELKNSSCSPNKMKHLLQNSSLLGHAEKSGLLQGNTVFVEFGAGRGMYMAWS
jgi:tRNA:m4X modification enzyme